MYENAIVPAIVYTDRYKRLTIVSTSFQITEVGENKMQPPALKVNFMSTK